MKSQNMTKWMVLAALCVLGLNAGCESEKQFASDFKGRCWVSGGEYEKGEKGEVCKCGGDPCSNGLTCVKNEGGRLGCAVCPEGSFRCLEEKLQYCKRDVDNDGNESFNWTDLNSCENSCIEDKEAKTAQCGECKNGESRCITTTTPEQVQKCINGKFQSKECGNNSCVKIDIDSEATCGDCKNGTTKCVDNNGNDAILTCSNGGWGNAVNCENGVSCVVDENNQATCGECYNNKTRAWLDVGTNHNIIQTCTNGMYQMSSDCNDNSVSYKYLKATEDLCEEECCNEECKDSDKTCIDECKQKRVNEICEDKCSNEFLDTSKYKECIDDCKKAQIETLCKEFECGTDDGECVALQNKCNQCESESESYTQNYIGLKYDCLFVDEIKCGECKTGMSKCENRADVNNQTQIGYKSTCENGKWVTVKCDSDVSCNADNTDCGECQNDVDVKCFDQNEIRIIEGKEYSVAIGYRASCKNGLFVKGDKCPNDNSCKISKELTKCESNSCECNSGEDKNTCSKGQYCKEEILEGAFHRKCVNAMSRCEENNCICGDVVCNRGEFCTIGEELNNVCVSANKCDASECTCGEIKCKNGEYCRDNATCVDASEVITGKDWACGDCQNDNPDYKVMLNQCGGDESSKNCHLSALKLMDQSVISECMNSDATDQCIEKSFHAVCDIKMCMDKTSDCDNVLSECYLKYNTGYIERIKKCGVTNNSLAYAITQVDKCEQESCGCGSQSCSKGQFCFHNTECIDEDKIKIGGVMGFENKKLFRCSDSDCVCGDQTCPKGKFCVGSSSCKYNSELNYTHLYACNNKSCPNCDNGDKCCDKDGNCIGVGDADKYVPVYEFVDSEGYVCRAHKGQCEVYLDEQKKCLDRSYSQYKNCLLECADSETKEKCQEDCVGQRSSDDSNCLNKTLEKVEPVRNLGERFEGCSYQENLHVGYCKYECRLGRRMPFNGVDACN